MSWIEFLGEAWETTPNDGELHLHLWPPLAQCPRRSWSLCLHHYDYDRSLVKRRMRRWLDFDLGNLHFHAPDWRSLSGLEIRADADWHARHEHHHEYGRLNTAEVNVRATYLGGAPGNPSPVGEGQSWQGHDFTLRIGQRAGFYFPCEIEAWLLPAEEYHRDVPETADQLRRFGEGPPDLRIITRAKFTGGTVVVPRSDDPISLTREYLRDQIALEDIHDPQIEWAIRRKAGSRETVSMPGWTSTVRFRTEPTPESAL